MRSVLAALLLAAGPPVARAQITVSDADGLREAMATATAGQTVRLTAGTYEVDGNLRTTHAGDEAAPITVRAEALGEVTIRFSRSDGGAVEGFLITEPDWVFENLVLEGVCRDHSQCEHAFHVVGLADRTVVRNNVARDFNAQIKGNGGGGEFPDDVLVEGNELYSTSVRMTSSPVTPIDVVGGSRWVIRSNFIHDHAKGMGDQVSYAAFLKGNSRDGVIERNLVICDLLHSGQVRLGLSFGGGGTSPDAVCMDGTCSPEHRGGVMRNNVIVRCPVDVGIFVRECEGCSVLHNTLFDTQGIDFLEGSTGEARGNLVDHRIDDRDTARTARGENLAEVGVMMMRRWFTDPDAADFTLATDVPTLVDQGLPHPDVTDDFCGDAREDGAPDIGAVEYDGDGPCDTASPGASPTPPDVDAGPPAGADAGALPPGTDGGPALDAGPPERDAGSRRDGGAGADGAGGGCGCAVEPGPGAGLLAISLLSCLGRRRNRVRRREG